jgi:hypothetical protein
MPFPFFAIRLLRYLFGRRFFLSNSFFLPILPSLQVVRRGSGALCPATHAHSTSHSQTYTTLIHPWALFPDGTRTRADLAVMVERVSLFLPPPYRQPLIDIHTIPWPGGGSFLRKNPPPSVGFEPTSAGTATSEHCLRQPGGHRATVSPLMLLLIYFRRETANHPPTFKGCRGVLIELMVF